MASGLDSIIVVSAINPVADSRSVQRGAYKTVTALVVSVTEFAERSS